MAKVTYEGTTAIVHPSGGNHSATVIICHGLGDSAEGWVDSASELASKLPHVKFVLPTAGSNPVTLNGGMSMPSWYDIVGLNERDNETAPGIEASAARITQIIQAETVPANRIVLGGFSQGAALSLWTGLQWKGEGLAGVVAMSGYLAGAGKFELSEAGKRTPVFQAHGGQDPLIRLAMAEKSKNHIQSLGHSSTYDFHLYPRMAHSACPEEMTDLIGFLAKVVPPLSEKPIYEMNIKELKQALINKGINPKQFLEKSEMIAALKQQ